MTLVGTDIGGRYRLERRLGAGGMSTVFLAVDQVLEREVAVKLLAEHLAEDEAFVARFRREALAAARLIHPNIVQVFDSGRDPETSRHHIVMEYVEGQSVADILRERHRLSPAEAVDIISQACNGLEYAHRHGVIHRDVKPGNLMINPDGVVKLADFGIAKAAEDSRITQIGSVLGTAAYLSPERARGEEASASSDVYSLGVVLYQMLSGRLPYETGSLTELALRQQEGAPDPLATLNSEVSGPLSRGVGHALAGNPAERYASAAEFGEAIRAALHGHDTAATVALETAATTHLPAATPPPPLPEPAAPPARRATRAPAAPRRARRAAPPPRARRGGLGRFLALLFLFALVAAAVAAIIVATDSSQSQEFERVVRDSIRDQVNGLRDLIDQAQRNFGDQTAG